MDFDVIPYEDIKGGWKKLGSGSFGNVYKGTYLGIDVAIKEVLPSKEYDVAKYFEREWRLMKEARHPNVVLYLGLSRAPPPDGRIFIISEYIENGNLRLYIHDKTKPFPWRLRMSFATDIARALAYLHARRCIHRDLKGENLLITTNGRLKITDFGFARIAARNEEETRRLTFCGTDSYMSPEILLGHEFDLPTDIFSLGVIFCEILARKLADDHHFKRTAPTFGIDAGEVHMLASPGCPPAFLALAIECCAEDPARRPTMVSILPRLRAIELEVLSRPSEADDIHVGSIKFMPGTKRSTAGPRIPSFGVGLGSAIRSKKSPESSSSAEDSEDELMEAVLGLEGTRLESEDDQSWRSSITEKAEGNGLISGDSRSDEPLIHHHPMPSDYSTAVVRTPSSSSSAPVSPPNLSSILTIKPEAHAVPQILPTGPTDSMLSIESYHTAVSSISIPSVAAATEGGSVLSIEPPGLLHRFTLIKPGAKRSTGSSSGASPQPEQSSHSSSVWSPFDFFFSSGLVAKCDICNKRLGWKPVLECDDCGLRAHIKCGELAPRDCGLRSPRKPDYALPSMNPLPGFKTKGVK